ncbi:hypothetical protein Tco_0568210 [Tanacetum coccineum]
MVANGAGDNGPPPAGGGDLPVLDVRTMEELCQPTLDGRVQNSCPFRGPGDDANKHLDKFLHVTQSMKVNGVSDDALRLYLFPYSLQHRAAEWFDRLPRNSITTFVGNKKSIGHFQVVSSNGKPLIEVSLEEEQSKGTTKKPRKRKPKTQAKSSTESNKAVQIVKNRTMKPLYPLSGKSVVMVKSVTKANVIPSYGHVRDLAARYITKTLYGDEDDDADQENGASVEEPRIKIQRISLTGFPAQSVGSSNTDVLDSPCLLVLITGMSQSRQHVITSSIQIDLASHPTKSIVDVGSSQEDFNLHCEYLSITQDVFWQDLKDNAFTGLFFTASLVNFMRVQQEPPVSGVKTSHTGVSVKILKTSSDKALVKQVSNWSAFWKWITKEKDETKPQTTQKPDWNGKD